MTNQKIPELVLRLGLAFVFIYAAIAAVIDPFSWIGFFPEFLRNALPENILLWGHSISEILLGLWLVSGWKTYYSAILASLAVFGIIIFNIGAMDIIFRDIGLLFSSIALAYLSKKYDPDTKFRKA